MNPDFLDILRALFDAEARFLIVGAYAVSVHAEPRATGDLDLWVEPTEANAAKVYGALQTFGAPLADLTSSDLAAPGLIFQIGVPPRRIDLMTSIDGVAFETAWPERLLVAVEGLDLPFLGREALLANKKQMGRPKDLLDIDRLEAEEAKK